MTIASLQEKLDRYMAYLVQDQTNPHLLLTTGLLNAHILHHQQQIPEAIGVLEALNRNHQSSPEIKGLLSLLYFDSQDAVKADVLSKQALSIDPTNYEAQLTRLLLQALDNKAALDDIDALIKIRPMDSRLWFVLGTTQMRHMNFPAAEQAFAKTTTIHPNFYDSWICAGWCHLLQNNVEKAQFCYQQAIKIDAAAADGWGGIALIHALQGQITEANATLIQSDAIDPACFLAAITRIILASSPEDAVTEFNKTFPNIAPEIKKIITQATQDSFK